MADRIYLSFWLRGFTEHNMLASLETVLEKFPFSRLLRHVTLRVYALEMVEPPALERTFADVGEPRELIEAAREFENPDCAYQVSSYWDLWQSAPDWALRPSPVAISCFAPLFPSDNGEQILIECGTDHLFLPATPAKENLLPVRSNVRSLLHLAADLEKTLRVEKRLLWAESGENFAERLSAALAGDADLRTGRGESRLG